MDIVPGAVYARGEMNGGRPGVRIPPHLFQDPGARVLEDQDMKKALIDLGEALVILAFLALAFL